MPSHSAIITATQKWIDTVIVKYNICPFARKEVQSDSIRYVIGAQTAFDQVAKQTLELCQQLDRSPSIATTLLILPNGFERFDRYLDLIDVIQAQVIAPQYEGIYQIASFHPDYCFADSDNNDAANYTNRAPYATVHIIREDSITQAVENHPDPESIPANNISLTRRKGLQSMAQLLAACHQQNQ